MLSYRFICSSSGQLFLFMLVSCAYNTGYFFLRNMETSVSMSKFYSVIISIYLNFYQMSVVNVLRIASHFFTRKQCQKFQKNSSCFSLKRFHLFFLFSILKKYSSISLRHRNFPTASSQKDTFEFEDEYNFRTFVVKQTLLLILITSPK